MWVQVKRREGQFVCNLHIWKKGCEKPFKTHSYLSIRDGLRRVLHIRLNSLQLGLDLDTSMRKHFDNRKFDKFDTNWSCVHVHINNISFPTHLCSRLQLLLTLLLNASLRKSEGKKHSKKTSVNTNYQIFEFCPIAPNVFFHRTFSTRAWRSTEASAALTSLFSLASTYPCKYVYVCICISCIMFVTNFHKLWRRGKRDLRWSAGPLPSEARPSALQPPCSPLPVCVHM